MFGGGDEIVALEAEFSDLEALREKPAQMAVFMNYLLSSSMPETLFFHLEIVAYRALFDEHGKKHCDKDPLEMATQLFGAYFAPNALLKIEVDEPELLSDATRRLTEAATDGDAAGLANLFDDLDDYSRSSLEELLDQFKKSLALGLGDLYGVGELQGIIQGDPTAPPPASVALELLQPHLSAACDESQAQDKKRSRLILASLLGFLTKVGVDPKALQEYSGHLDKGPQQKNSGGGFKLLRAASQKKKVKVHVHSNHQFVATHYNYPTFCDHCGDLLWGIGNQGYQCTACGFNCHKRKCNDELKDPCGGPKSRKPSTTASPNSPRKLFSMDSLRISSRRQPGDQPSERRSLMDSSMTSSTSSVDLVVPGQSARRKSVSDASVSRDISIRPSIVIDEGFVDRLQVPQQVRRFSQGDDAPDVVDISPLPPTPQSPTAPLTSGVRYARGSVTAPPLEMPLGMMPLDRSHSTNDLDVRKASAEFVDITRSPSLRKSASGSNTDVSHPPLRKQNSFILPSVEKMASNWVELATHELLEELSKKEKKRQEVIFELVKTEVNYISDMMAMQTVFYQPLRKFRILAGDQIAGIFVNVDEIVDLNLDLCKALVERQQESTFVEVIGDIFAEKFEGFTIYGAFCGNQTRALEDLQLYRRKNAQFASFLKDCEANPRCKRKALNDLLAMPMQRLTRYPLLLETIMQATPKSHKDYPTLLRATQMVKDVVTGVNEQVKRTQNMRRLAALQKTIDSSALGYSLDIMGVPREVLHEGQLTLSACPQTKNRNATVHAILFSDLVLLTYKKDVHLIVEIEPIPLYEVLVRNVESLKERCAFFLVSTSLKGPRMYELIAESEFEKKAWIAKIMNAARACGKPPLGLQSYMESLKKREVPAEGTDDASSSGPAAPPDTPDTPDTAHASLDDDAHAADDTLVHIGEIDALLAELVAVAAQTDGDLIPLVKRKHVLLARLDAEQLSRSQSWGLASAQAQAPEGAGLGESGGSGVSVPPAAAVLKKKPLMERSLSAELLKVFEEIRINVMGSPLSDKFETVSVADAESGKYERSRLVALVTDELRTARSYVANRSASPPDVPGDLSQAQGIHVIHENPASPDPLTRVRRPSMAPGPHVAAPDDETSEEEI
eukprot:Opistho-2@79167